MAVSAPALGDAFAAIVGGEHLTTAPSPLAAAAVDGVTPRWLARPGSLDEVSRVLALASAEGLAVAPRGGGSALDLGAPPSRLDAVLDLSRLAGILEYVPADMVTTVQAGVTLDTLGRELGKHGQMLALDPYGGGSRTVGGVLATNASGQRRFRYGTGRDLLLGARFVQADGTVTWGGSKVVKSVTGYDIPKLLTGSLGTLGVIVEATLRLHPVQPASGSWLFSFTSHEAAGSLVAAVLASSLEPERLAWLNAAALEHVGSERAEAALAVSVATVAEAVTSQGALLGLMASRLGARVSALDEGFWTRLGGALAGSTVVKLASEIRRLPFWAGEVERVTARHGLTVSLVGEAGNGILRAAVEGSALPDTWAGEIVGPLREALAAEGGSLAVERAPLYLKSAADVWGPIPESALAVMRRLKAEFDPRGVLNPGRFVGGL
ncbi:MAG: FAD-binding oxidoreductase [Candidatus Rokubacteria bacterium]|nr:FAD-binding oxidoreductase [Candidatus Rokubacteria bacterium]